MARLEFIVLVLIKCANCAFFDLTDVDDPLSLLWQSKDSFRQSNAACRVVVPGTAFVVTGQCKYKSLCLLAGGQSNTGGNCGNFLTCCTATSAVTTKCSQSTKSKVSYFIGDSSLVGTECEYTVHVQNSNVCQIRLDFEQFQLAYSSRQEQLATTPTTYTTACSNDYMTVTPNVYNIPKFCGSNDDQHVYVHLNSQKVVTLQVVLVNRTAGVATEVPSPSWRIKITQLECPANHTFFSKHNIFDSAKKDFPLLAPSGATQYFTELTGRIRSFGFNGAQSEYISGLFYTIAFKRTPDVNCIRFTSNYLEIRTVVGGCWDYLFIPELVVAPATTISPVSRMCGELNPTLTHIFYSRSPGSFYIHFRSQPTYTIPDNLIRAFDIQYELMSCTQI